MSGADPDQKRDYCMVEADPSLAAPAVRMIIVAAACHGGAPGYWTYPVLAIQAFNRHKFSRPADGEDLMPPPSVAAAEDYGWDWEWSEIDYESIILDPDFGLGPATMALGSRNIEWREFVADWPADEDEDRLRDDIAALMKRAAAKVTEKG